MLQTDNNVLMNNILFAEITISEIISENNILYNFYKSKFCYFYNYSSYLFL